MIQRFMLHAQNTYFIIFSDHFGPVPGFLLVLTVLFLVSTRQFRNGSVSVCSKACSSAVIGVKMSEYGTILYLTRNGTAE